MELGLRLALKLAAEDASTLGGLDLYLFGSAARNFEGARDVDILAIYDNSETVRAFRRLIEERSSFPPFHLVALTPREEEFYRFIRGVGAVCFLRSRNPRRCYLPRILRWQRSPCHYAVARG
jgi:predicted nucleotidyltransferase